ncbi:translocation/assembly module TamB domain-containing protein [uncultured Thiodictyon sp.]|uniref:translocation/assembly module TamB domain-containing protein n=1 Tax=uncultured Thiodictyon sp. TaxID=1846217 RepID=UPI002600F368|nr:translocation/assembly module TamB domain-containing protein [uncultured Thiodictyon sp.]
MTQDTEEPVDSASPSPEAAAAETTAPPGRRRRHPVVRVLRLLGLTALKALLLVFVLLGFLLGTQTGLRTALTLAAELAPGVLQVGQADGRVLGRLHLESVAIKLVDLDLHLGRVDLDWSPLAAVTGTLRIARIAASDIEVVTTPSEAAEFTLITLPQIVLPLEVEVGEAVVENLRVLQRGAAQPLFVLERGTLAARLTGSELDLAALELVLPESRLTAKVAGQAQLADKYPLDLKLDWNLTQLPKVKIHGVGYLKGDLARLTVASDLTGSVELGLEAHLDDVLGRPRWDAVVQINEVRVPDFQADAPQMAVRGRLETHGDLNASTLTGNLDGTAPNRADFGHLQVALDAGWQDQRLDLRTLTLTESVSGARFNAKGGLDLKASPGTFNMAGDWERLRWPLTGDLLATAPQGRFDASGTFDAYDYSLAWGVAGPAFPTVDLTLKGQGDAKGTRIAALKLVTLDGSVDASGALTWAPDLAWDFKVRGQDLNPVKLAPGVADRIFLTLATKGAPAGFGYDLMLSSQGPGLPPARLAVGGKGDAKGTEVQSLRLDILKGRIEGRGRATWAPGVTWEADLTATGIDPGSYAPAWPGRIDGRLTSSGTLEAKGPNLTAAIEGLQGTLRGYPISAAGRLRMAEGTIRVEGLTASSGPSTARVDGVIAQTLDLRFDLASPDLASLLPGAKGSFQAKGQVQGEAKAPTLGLELNARDAEFNGQGIAGLSGSLNLGLGPAAPLRIQLDGRGLAVGGLRWETLQVRGDGSLPRHRLSLAAIGEPLTVRLEAAGGLATTAPLSAYQGTLSRLDLDSQGYGNWRLQRPMPLRLAGPKVAAGPLCLRDAQGSGGCVGFEQTDIGQWSANIDLAPLGAELIQGLLPQTMTAQGAARVKGGFAAKGPVLTGSLVAEVPQGLLRLVVAGGRSEELDFSRTRLTLDSGTSGMRARLDLPLKGLGQLGGSVDLPGWRLDAPARPGQPLGGAIHGNITGLARVSNLVPDLTGVTGALALDFALGGTLGRPGVKGQGTLRGFGAEAPLTGTKIANLDLTVTAPTLERLTIQGQGGVGGRLLTMAGEARTGADGFSGALRIAGDRLKVADTKEYFVLLSPAINVNLSPQGAQVRGEIAVPEARIRPRKIPAGAILPSPDVVLVDQAGPRSPPFPVDIDLRLKLGNNVTIDAFGVRGQLIGDLRVLQAPGQEMLGDGQLAIVDGTYRFNPGVGLGTDLIPLLSDLGTELGAPLTITQGRLVYARSPIGNPGLLLLAQRESGNLSAGVRVVGTLRNSKLAFFSESDPGMNQADITKYLLTGVAPSGEAGQGGQALSVGTYVAPKLYMEYVSGTGDTKDAVKLRYELSRSIELQTETGNTPGGDIFYKFER